LRITDAVSSSDPLATTRRTIECPLLMAQVSTVITQNVVGLGKVCRINASACE
jgi:hypothetical protein